VSDPLFKEIWAADFEFDPQKGERYPEPVCLVAWELRSRRKIRLWKNQLGENPPYSISADSLFVSFSVPAELSCHLALGWPLPARILDLRIEFLRAINTTPPHPDYRDAKLLHALAYYGVDGIDAAEKTYWQELVMRGGPWTAEEQKGILDYCETDVAAAEQLLRRMRARGHIPFDRRLVFSLYRGRAMGAVTRMQSEGIPIDMDRYSRYLEREEPIKDQLVVTLGAEYGVYDAERSFSEKRFARYLAKRGWGWPVLESGRLELKNKTFKAMAEIHPELEPLRQLRYTLDDLKLNELVMGKDGFNRCWLNPFGGRTGRNQPSNSGFIFGPAVWLRDFLIQAKPGWGLAYIDWVGQEFGIAAGLSRDPLMLEAYQSADIYVAFGRQAQRLPTETDEQMPPTKREQFKVCVLSTQYGSGYRSLSERIDQPDIVGRELLGYHHHVYRRFWQWSDNTVNHALFYNWQRTVFDWKHRFEERPKINSVRNFHMQANGAEMLRLACCLGTENGIHICAPVHDAVLITAPINQLEADILRMRNYMAEASRVVLAGFELRTDYHTYIHPNHYHDPKGRGDKMLELILRLL
jgi:hypothetical protein